MAIKLDDIKGYEQPFHTLGMKVPSHNTQCPNPEHGGSDSVSTSIVDGVVLWHCHNPVCDKSGSIVDAYMMSYGVDEKEAIRLLANEFGDGELEYDRPSADFGKFEVRNPIGPTSYDVAVPDKIKVGVVMRDAVMARYKGDKNNLSLNLNDATSFDIAPFEMSGRVYAAGVIRWDAPGKKALYQCHYENGKWKSGSISGLNASHVPIYKMHEIANSPPETLIIIVEGEKCMNALQASLDEHHYNYKDTVPKCIVTTNIGGSNALGKAFLEPLEGRDAIVVLPDKDEPGIEYAKKLKKSLPQALIVNPYPDDAWDGYDSADWIEQGHDTRAIFRAEEAEIDVERDPLEYARVVAAQLKADDIDGYLREVEKLNLSPIDLNGILEVIALNTGIGKTLLRETYKEIRKENTTDWPTVISDYVMKKKLGGKVVYVTDAFWIYTGKYWRRYDEDVVKGIIFSAIRTQLPGGKMDYSQCMERSYKLMKGECATHDDVLHLREVPPPIINVRNGELHIRPNGTVELRKHSPASGLTYCLDIDYNPAARCPEYDRAVSEIFEMDKNMVRHWHEVGGYIIQPVRDLKNFFMGYGKRGHNGKSSLFTLVTALVGKENIAAVKLKEFGKSRFDTSMLVGKILMLDDDLDKGVKLNDGLMKQISEQKLITGEFKNGAHFQFMQYAAPVMLCNHMPSTNDLTKAMLTRANIIPFNAYFDPEDKKTDKGLFKRIAETELAGVLNRFIEGMGRLRARGKWDYPLKSILAKDVWLSETNNTYLFVKEMLVKNGDSTLTANDIYDAYINWTKDAGVSDRYNVKKASLKRSLEELELEIESASARDGRWKVEGYALVDLED